MAVPRSSAARDYFRCALQRYDEARFLLDADYSNAAVYLGGYSVECALKALILDAVPSSRAETIRTSFVGRLGHDYDWLRSVYYESGGPRIPAGLIRAFSLVSGWSTDLRYSPRRMRMTEASVFLTAVAEILHWSEQRF